MFCADVHGHLAQIEVCADARRGRNACGAQHVKDHPHGQLARGKAVCGQIVRHIHHHLVDGIDVYILGRKILQIDLIDLGAGLHIARHMGRRDNVIQRERGVVFQRGIVAGGTGKPAPRCAPLPLRVYLAHFLHHLKQPRPARDAVGFQRRGYRKADGFFRAAGIRDNKIGSQRVQAAPAAFHRGVKAF